MAFQISNLPPRDIERTLGNAKAEAAQLAETPSVMGRQGAVTRFAGQIFERDGDSFAAQAYDPKHPGKKNVESWFDGYMNGIFSPQLSEEKPNSSSNQEVV